MKLDVLLKEESHAVLCSQAQRAVCAGWRPPPFQTRSQASVGDKPVGSLGPEGTKVHSHPPGKAEGKGEAHLASLVPPGAKAIPKPKGKRAETLPAAADEESHFGKYLSKTKTKQKPKKMVV